MEEFTFPWREATVHFSISQTNTRYKEKLDQEKYEECEGGVGYNSRALRIGLPHMTVGQRLLNFFYIVHKTGRKDHWARKY